MTFEYVDVASLIVWIIFVTWQRWPLSRDDVKWYERHLPNLNYVRVPSIVFPIVWTILHILVIASHFLYFHFASASAEDWHFITVMVLSIVNLILAQYWTFFFFTMRRLTIGFGIAILLFCTALVNVIIMGLSDGIVGTLWPLPMALYIPYVIWLAFACLLNYDWMTSVKITKK